MPDVLDSPQDGGRLECIVIRPAEDQREVLPFVQLSPERGVEGDRWVELGKIDPSDQVSLMNSRILRLIAGSEERMALAGDNLVVDMDLSAANVPLGQRLAVGEALLEISGVPHTGCGAFAERFGADATRYINASERKEMHLRGRYARVIEAGKVTVGDVVRKV